MKFLCFGYYDKARFDTLTEAEQDAMFDTCFPYDDQLRANGHYAREEALQAPQTALTLRLKDGKVATANGLRKDGKTARRHSHSRSQGHGSRGTTHRPAPRAELRQHI